MTSIYFLAGWAVRSSVLILAGALLLWVLRVKSSSIRLAVWTALLCASLALPVLTAVLPGLPLVMQQPPPARVEATISIVDSGPARGPATLHQEPPQSRFDWARAAIIAYILVALTLLLRLCVGVTLSLRLLRSSRTTDIGVRESDSVTAPVTLGILRPAIVLPGDWSKWDAAKLDAVLAHERSHIQRRDPAVQLLSAIHRALLWHSPLSWFLHRSIVRTAEDASDDAAVSVTQDRALYAEVLLDFMQRGVRRASWIGVPMARYGKVEARIHRILDGTTLSRGVSRWGIAAMVVLGAPVAYVVSAAQPQQPVARPQTTARPPAPVAAQQSPQSARQGPVYLNGLGTVTASSTVVIKARLDGQLTSLGFEEGGPVQAGQVLASIGSVFGDQLARAEADLARDKAQLADDNPKPLPSIAQLKNRVKTDEEMVSELKLRLAYSEVRSPITGIAGLRMVDPGNMVHDGENIVVVTQIQPIAVLFNIPEDSLSGVLARRQQGTNPPVEAWNRDNTVLLATGRLAAVDNLIDTATGTAKLKAVFDNKDGRLFPNQFVNVRLLMGQSR